MRKLTNEEEKGPMMSPDLDTKPLWVQPRAHLFFSCLFLEGFSQCSDHFHVHFCLPDFLQPILVCLLYLTQMENFAFVYVEFNLVGFYLLFQFIKIFLTLDKDL